MMRRLVLVGALMGGSLLAPTASASESVPPSAWPSNSSVQPRLDTWPNVLRIHGANRYQTALAATLVLRGEGADDSYPYGDPDPATTNGWWGLDTCPRSVIIVAGDNPADALAANSLSDPTGNSSEPYLQRSAAADPVFYPPGGFARVDTDFAPILTTTSARQGATRLDIATRLAAQELSRGACTTARQAIVVGGVRAVDSAIDAELLSIGYDEVFRIAGSSRYQTARLVAESLGTDAVERSTCIDASSRGGAQMSFYANSVVEYRESATDCRLLQRTVVLADGITGIDALASGWWTSFWQVPILLTDDDETLPSQTREALQTLRIDNLVVLGGTSRISEATVGDAVDLSGATNVIRISGSDRYATSLAMAQYFGGWWNTGQAADAEGSVMCVTASSGGSRSVPGIGWADALAAGPWCARLGVARAASGGPARALSPVTGGSAAVSSTAGTTRALSHRAVPMILVPAGANSLTTSVAASLSSVFDPAGDWCSGDDAPEGCLAPGFVVAFGGSSLVSDALVAQLDGMVSGGTSEIDDRHAEAPMPFFTTLNMAPVFDEPHSASDNGDEPRICVTRGSYQHARWLVAKGATTTSFDLVSEGAYGADADDEVRSPGTGRPVCWAVDPADTTRVWAVSATGGQPASGQVTTLNLAENARFSLSADLPLGPPTATSGPDSDQDDSNGGTTSWTFAGAIAGVTGTTDGETAAVNSADVEISIERGRNSGSTTGPDVFTAEFTITTTEGTVRGDVEGEAILVSGVWQLRGVVTYKTGSWSFDRGRGGFTAAIDTDATSASTNDMIVWRVDGVTPT